MTLADLYGRIGRMTKRVRLCKRCDTYVDIEKFSLCPLCTNSLDCDEEDDVKTIHVTEDTKRPTGLRRQREIKLPSGERITRYEAKKRAKEERDKDG